MKYLLTSLYHKILTGGELEGSEIYIGCSDGSLLRYALQANDPHVVRINYLRSYHIVLMMKQPGAYALLSQQTLPTNKAIDAIEILPSINRALILSGTYSKF